MIVVGMMWKFSSLAGLLRTDFALWKLFRGTEACVSGEVTRIDCNVQTKFMFPSPLSLVRELLSFKNYHDCLSLPPTGGALVFT